MKLLKHLFLLFALFTAAAGYVRAAEKPVNTTWRGVALDGYDAVAYFTDGKPTEGDERFSYEWSGAKWRFANAEHLERFKQDPARYAPQFGGYCAWAVSEGYTADADPTAWKIVDGKLYLNYNAEVQKKWEQDVPGRIAKGNANWPKVSRK
ncbi:MAG TPA: YHS domain-containing (seleno)protein [Opitutaceae bacterium]